MPSVSEPPTVSNVVSPEEMESLDRLLKSNSISRAPRLQAVLRFIIDAYLEGKGQEVNEQVIGQRVFDRPAGYNPSDDNIVRVTVRHLRSRLEEYYRTEGSQEPYVVDIPKGKYLLTLQPRVSTAVESVGVSSAPDALSVGRSELQGSGLPPASSSLSAVASPWRRWGVVGVLGAALLLVTLWAITQSMENKRLAHVADAAPSTISQLIAGHGNNRMTVVVADANLQAYRAIYKKQIQLQDYIDRSYARTVEPSSDPKMAAAWQFATGTTETNIASSLVAAELQRASAPIITDIKHPHDLRMRDFQEESIVLLGGPWINPWGQMFEDRFNFRIVPADGDPSGSELLNLHPKAGEPAAFAPHHVGGIPIDYVRIALLPNLSGKGRVIILGATNQQSLSAAGDFLADPNSITTLTKLLHADSPAKLPYFEIVIEVRGLDDVPQETKVVAYRTISDAR